MAACLASSLWASPTPLICNLGCSNTVKGRIMPYGTSSLSAYNDFRLPLPSHISSSRHLMQLKTMAEKVKATKRKSGKQNKLDVPLVPVTVLVLGLETVLLDNRFKLRRGIENALRECTSPFYISTSLSREQTVYRTGMHEIFAEKGDFSINSNRILNSINLASLIEIDKRSPPNTRFIYIDGDQTAIRGASRIPELKDWDLFYATHLDKPGFSPAPFPRRITSVNGDEIIEIVKTGAPAGQIWDTYLPGHDELPTDGSTTVSDHALKG
ncbi:hypothetical protein AAMO2058_000407100 [Amorphochlora amoebiformis]